MSVTYRYYLCRAKNTNFKRTLLLNCTVVENTQRTIISNQQYTKNIGKFVYSHGLNLTYFSFGTYTQYSFISNQHYTKNIGKFLYSQFQNLCLKLPYLNEICSKLPDFHYKYTVSLILHFSFDQHLKRCLSSILDCVQ